jgi:subtilisin family serine protease
MALAPGPPTGGLSWRRLDICPAAHYPLSYQKGLVVEGVARFGCPAGRSPYESPTMLDRLPVAACLPALLAALAALPAAAPAPRPAATQAVLAASPAALEAVVPLGSRTTLSVTLSNLTSAPLTPAVYEALASPAEIAAAPPPDGLRQPPLPHQSERLDPALLRAFGAPPVPAAEFIVYLREQADLSAAYAIRNWEARGAFVYQTLKTWAERTQGPLRADLRARRVAFHPFWIVNAVLVRGALADAQALAARSDVALVRANHAAALPPPQASAPAPAAADYCSPDRPGDPVCWNIRRIGADRVWREVGVTGVGVVVASVDTGVSYLHPALAPHYRGALGGGAFTHDYNWFDPQHRLPAPADAAGHGTHTMGTLVGGAPGGPAIGVAPGAQWIAAQGCENYVCDDADLFDAAQWLLAPTRLDGSDPRPDLRPMVINNSWGGLSDNYWYAGYVAAWRAAGMFPVFAAGNISQYAPQQCGTIASPGDYPNVVAVGATDADDNVAGFSLLGPTADGRMKPDFSAPGTYRSYRQGILSAAPDGGYQMLQGTSMATPLVAGAVALLWAARPDLIGDYDATYALLRDSAVRRSDTRCGDPPGQPNNVYGYGRIDVFAAVARARVDVPWLATAGAPAAIAPSGAATLQVTLDAGRVPGPGAYRARLQIYGDGLARPPTTIPVTLTVEATPGQGGVSGRVRSAETGEALAATVRASGGLPVATGADGSFRLTLAPGTYTLEVRAAGYMPLARQVDVHGDLPLGDLLLAPDGPRLAVEAPEETPTLRFNSSVSQTITIRNTGTQPLQYSVRQPVQSFVIVTSDEPGGPAYDWIDLPASAHRLTLGDTALSDRVPLGIPFPFYDVVFTDTLITSDGMLSFIRPERYAGPGETCLPDQVLPFYTIAPFRADLDPSHGGQIRYGALPERQAFVVSYERVPLHASPATQTYSFQVLLYSDGRIVFQYRDLPALPAWASVGVQRTPVNADLLGCGRRLPVGPGRAVEFRPQPPSWRWLRATDADDELAPGERRDLPVTFVWTRLGVGKDLRAAIHIRSSDPRHADQAIPLAARMLPAPVERWLLYLARE